MSRISDLRWKVDRLLRRRWHPAEGASISGVVGIYSQRVMSWAAILHPCEANRKLASPWAHSLGVGREGDGDT